MTGLALGMFVQIVGHGHTMNWRQLSQQECVARRYAQWELSLSHFRKPALLEHMERLLRGYTSSQIFALV